MGLVPLVLTDLELSPRHAGGNVVPIVVLVLRRSYTLRQKVLIYDPIKQINFLLTPILFSNVWPIKSQNCITFVSETPVAVRGWTLLPNLRLI